MRKLILVILFVLVPVCAFANMCNYEQLAEIDDGHFVYEDNVLYLYGIENNIIHWSATNHGVIPFKEIDRVSITTKSSEYNFDYDNDWHNSEYLPETLCSIESVKFYKCANTPLPSSSLFLLSGLGLLLLRRHRKYHG